MGLIKRIITSACTAGKTAAETEGAKKLIHDANHVVQHGIAHSGETVATVIGEWAKCQGEFADFVETRRILSRDTRPVDNKALEAMSKAVVTWGKMQAPHADFTETVRILSKDPRPVKNDWTENLAKAAVKLEKARVASNEFGDL